MNAVVKGAKSGSSNTRTPVVAEDSAQSKTYIKLQYGMSEGEIEGLADGAKSIFLDDTPILDSNGGDNFLGVTWDFRTGTNDQTYMEGFPEVSNDTDVNVELKTNAWVRSISNTVINAARVRLRFGALRTTNASNGDVTGVTIKYAIDISTDGGAYVTMIDTQISDKTSSNYERSHRIDLPKATSGWNIRVRRLTPPAQSDYVSDSMYVASYAEVIDAKFRYPNTALLGLQYDAENFSSVAKVAVRAKGIKVRVPTNYDPIARTYSGIWDGSFKRSYSNNPAWIYYDLCTQKRYGLGERITDDMLDKASLYRLAQYCDGFVSDGAGGLEPRFTCNVYIQSAEDAYSIFSKLAGVFRAISYWDGDSIVCDADIPQDVYFNYTNANVINGTFEYSGTRARDRHTVAKVAWSNPDNRFKTEYEIVRDENAIAKHGVKIVEIAAWGCTSRGQAQRAGLWAIRSEQYETQTVSFKVGLDGNIPVPGKVISVADNDYAGRFIGGRISTISSDRKTLTLDREVIANAGDKIYINSESGQSVTNIISTVSGNKVTVQTAFASNLIAAQNAWTIDSSELATRKFRVMTITQDEEHQFSITALEYNAQKYDAIDSGAHIQEAPVSIINPTTQAAPKNVTFSTYDQVQQGINVATMVIQWDKAEFAVKYLVEWKKDDGTWIRMPLTGNTSVEVAGIYSGNYQARVTAISAFDISSLPTSSVLTTLSGKTGTPPQLAFIRATGTMFGMKVDWGFPAKGASDTAYTEIQVSTSSNGTNATQLGFYAYPTTSLQQQGLAANVTLYYRGRLVDKIGNVGAWSGWTSGTSTAQVNDILDALSGQITEDQLDQDLRQNIDQIDINKTAISKEITDRINAIANEANQRATAISTEKTERQAADSNLSSRIDTVSASAGSNTAAIQQEATARAGADSALSTRIDTVVTKTGENTAAIQSEVTARTNADSALGTRIDAVVVDLNGKATTGALNEVKSTVQQQGSLISANTTKIDGVYAQVNPPMAGSTTDMAGSSTQYAGVWSEMSARIESDIAQSIRTDQVVAQINDNDAIYKSQIKAVADANSALVTKTDTLQTTIDGNTATIQTQQQSINGLNAQYTIKTDVNGLISGFGLASSSTSSEFLIRANRFAIAPPSGSGNTGKYAFVYNTTSTTLPNGTVIPAGLYLNDAVIGSVDATKINATSLNALTANFGTWTSTSTDGAKTVQTGAKREVYAPNGTLIMRDGWW
ncbi:host specificity protein J [Acinetobacter sp. S40]|uniref:host specificity protein J n=1 Tax=Acinetobacter sp. S40 TaxID=2767434 RepID=UPI00190CFF64|nr:phage tail protein [Acinetobacter sp. S40]MBJ9984421.1 host specificity protein J [Acinetobacter sp. S40]